MAKLIAHKAVELDKVKAVRKRVLSQPGYLDQHYIAQPKYDGCFAAVFSLDPTIGDAHMRTRTGEIVRSCNHILENVSKDFGPNCVVFGEVWHPTMKQSEISGAFRRQSVQHQELVFVAFDVVSMDEFHLGHAAAPWAVRNARLWGAYYAGVGALFQHVWCPATYYNQGTYGKHEDLRDEYLAKGGYDGLILRDPNAPWILGTGTGGEIIKSKRVLSFDLEVLGVNEGVGKMKGLAGTLTLRWKDGRTIEAGGLDYGTRTEWFENPQAIIGGIVQVEAMDYSTDGLLREPRITAVRYDKDKADF